MAPVNKIKRTKSAPNARAPNLFITALKKNQSMETHPSTSNSSPVSVKKQAISSNLQKQLTKKRKIVRRKILGIKNEVLFNGKGEPYGDVATEMQSYIGVLARTKFPIMYSSWKLVPKETKNKIWDCMKAKMKNAVREGEVIFSGVDDVLAKVLGNAEHRGRVRG
ncbi:hypothetical protein AgCh_008004 [Apium graveolens]